MFTCFRSGYGVAVLRVATGARRATLTDGVAPLRYGASNPNRKQVRCHIFLNYRSFIHVLELGIQSLSYVLLKVRMTRHYFRNVIFWLLLENACAIIMRPRLC